MGANASRVVILSCCLAAHRALALSASTARRAVQTTTPVVQDGPGSSKMAHKTVESVKLLGLTLGDSLGNSLAALAANGPVEDQGDKLEALVSGCASAGLAACAGGAAAPVAGAIAAAAATYALLNPRSDAAIVTRGLGRSAMDLTKQAAQFTADVVQDTMMRDEAEIKAVLLGPTIEPSHLLLDTVAAEPQLAAVIEPADLLVVVADEGASREKSADEVFFLEAAATATASEATAKPAGPVVDKPPPTGSRMRRLPPRPGAFVLLKSRRHGGDANVRQEAAADQGALVRAEDAAARAEPRADQSSRLEEQLDGFDDVLSLVRAPRELQATRSHSQDPFSMTAPAAPAGNRAKRPVAQTLNTTLYAHLEDACDGPAATTYISPLETCYTSEFLFQEEPKVAYGDVLDVIKGDKLERTFFASADRTCTHATRTLTLPTKACVGPLHNANHEWATFDLART